MARARIEIPTSDEIEQMTTQDLRKLVTRLNSAANKRLKRLEKADLKQESWAYTAIKSSLVNDKFSVKGAKTRKQLVNRLKGVSTFLGYTTSTVSGTRAEMKRIEELFGGRTDHEEMRQIARLINELQKENPALFNIAGSKRIYRYVSEQLDYYNTMSLEYIIEDALIFMNNVYEQRINSSYRRGKRI